MNVSVTQRKKDSRFTYKGTIYGIMNKHEELMLLSQAGCSFTEGTVMQSMNYKVSYKVTRRKRDRYAQGVCEYKSFTATIKGIGKEFPVEAWSGPACSMGLTLPDFQIVGT